MAGVLVPSLAIELILGGLLLDISNGYSRMGKAVDMGCVQSLK